MNAELQRWVSDEGGQDLIEYLLLGSFLAIASWVGLQLLETAINTTYQSWDKASQEIWEVPDPVPDAAGS
jgi:Flp pilus assembly pilin Flp